MDEAAGPWSPSAHLALVLFAVQTRLTGRLRLDRRCRESLCRRGRLLLLFGFLFRQQAHLLLAAALFALAARR